MTRARRRSSAPSVLIGDTGSAGESLDNTYETRIGTYSIPLHEVGDGRANNASACIKGFANSSCSVSDGGESVLRDSLEVAGEKRTDRAVRCLRAAMIFTLVTATTTAACVMYFVSHNAENQSFSQAYKGAVIKLAEGFQNNIDRKVLAAASFSAMYTSRYGGDNSHWPNATMPNFQEQADGQLRLAEGRALSFNPIITNATREGWEAHSTESADMLGTDSAIIRQSNTSRVVSDGVFRVSEGKRVDDPGWSPNSTFPDVMVPVWQIAPIVGNENAVMFNLHGERNRQRALDDMMTYNLPVLTAIIQLVQDTILRPSSILFYPVRAAFSREGQLDHVIGSISIVFSWDDVLSRILPSHLHGLVCVLQTNTGQEFTFRLGDKVEFLGQGDLHDSSFDSLAYPVDANLEETNKVLGNVDHLITYQLIVYPSVQFESQYKTSKPALYTFGVVLIFFCTAALFCLYDYLVTMRQSTVAKAAQQTGDIVNAMFPAAFRDRLFRAQELQSVDNTNTGGRDEGRPRQRKGGHLASSEHGRLTGFVGSSIHVRSMKKFIRGKGIHPGEYNVDVNFRDAPIADLFPATSIMFCDIVGFTQWSAQHGPNEVFQLLETLFWEFDQLAEKYGVFKLGTIGDCYIAVTGIPEPIPNHASILAEFTIECNKKVVEVTSGLSSLDGVANLSMRFGIHSGPITAGILPGKKSRFELFGDTINSASRMESTSLPNCIQVSEETAAYLREEGMGGWLAPREGLVSVKGKGQLSTFWLISPTDDDEEPCNTARALSWPHRRRRSSFLAAFGFSESKPAKPSGWSHSDAVITEMEEGRR